MTVGRKPASSHLCPPVRKSTITSTMISVDIDRSDPTLLHDQVAPKSAVPSPKAKPGPGTACPWPRTSPPSSG